jgi:hypothetical protein
VLSHPNPVSYFLSHAKKVFLDDLTRDCAFVATLSRALLASWSYLQAFPILFNVGIERSQRTSGHFIDAVRTNHKHTVSKYTSEDLVVRI